MADQEKLAHMLSAELQKTVEKFKKKHPPLTINGIPGAGSVFTFTWLLHAPTKEKALEAHEENAKIIRHLIDEAPDYFFENKASNLN